MTQPPIEPPPPPPPPAPDYGSAPYQPPQPPKSSAFGALGSRAVRIAISVGLVLAIGAGIRAFQNSQDDGERDDKGNLTDEQELSVFSLKQGDCLDDDILKDIGIIGQEVDEVKAIPCDKPHTLEAYHVFDLDGDEFPGTVEVDKQASKGCTDAFGPFVGLPFDKSTLSLSYLYPQELSWTEADDRSVTCLIGEADGKATTGSLEGVKR